MDLLWKILTNTTYIKQLSLNKLISPLDWKLVWVLMPLKLLIKGLRAAFEHILIYGEPAHGSLVLIAYASSEGSGETAQTRSLVRAFAARTL